MHWCILLSSLPIRKITGSVSLEDSWKENSDTRNRVSDQYNNRSFDQNERPTNKTLTHHTKLHALKIYTKTGDTGTTALFTGKRVPKHHIRIESYGTLDELNSWLGLLRDQEIDSHYQSVLEQIQDMLFTVGAILATEPTKDNKLKITRITEDDSQLLEIEIDKMNNDLPPMTHFILPGGHTTVSYCHVARTVCRRAERLISILHQENPLPKTLLSYINRLSDYLFVLARKLSKDLNAKEVKWIPEKHD